MRNQPLIQRLSFKGTELFLDGNLRVQINSMLCPEF